MAPPPNTILYSVHNSSVCVESGWCTGGGGGVFVMYTIEIHNLHLRAGASQSRDSASQSRDEIPTFTCIMFLHHPSTIPHP